MKLNKKTIGAIIFAVFVLLLFFSRTIYNYNLPNVIGARPFRGGLSKLEISTGIAAWAETDTIYAISAGIVGQVFIREGDYVEKDQRLFEMDFDITAAERQMSEIINNINKLEADIHSFNLRLGNIREALITEREIASSPEDSANTGRSLSGQAAMIALELNMARRAFNNTQFAFELGIQSRNDMINAENNYLALLHRYEAEAAELEHTVFLRRMDLENLRLSRETIREILVNYRNNAVITAPSSGVIHTLAAERGKFFPENALLVSIGIGREFIVESTISLDNNFVNPGDTCELSNAYHVLNGIVQRVRPHSQGKTVTITVLSDEVNEGETFIVTFEENTAANFILVPNSSINQDNDGYFIYQIKRRRGIMGEEYYLERLNVYIGDSDHQNTIVIRGITFLDPIVLTSNKALSAGMTVSLMNMENFFEN